MDLCVVVSLCLCPCSHRKTVSLFCQCIWVLMCNCVCVLLLTATLCLCFYQRICVLLCLCVCGLVLTATLCLFFANVFLFSCVTVFVSFFSPQHCVFFLLGPCVSASVGEVCLALSPGSEIIIDQYHHNYYRQIITFEPLEACNQSFKNDWNSRWPCCWWPFNGDLDGGCPSLSFYYAEWQTALTDSISATVPSNFTSSLQCLANIFLFRVDQGFAGILFLENPNLINTSRLYIAKWALCKENTKWKFSYLHIKLQNFDNMLENARIRRL